jgi:CRP/FNR family transcriptional regulator, cyclic AMP receptor protein
MRKVLYILGQLSDEDVDWMAVGGRRRDARAGEVLIHEGVPISSVLVVLQGTASVTLGGGREVARIGAGEVLGEMSMIDNRPPSATVTAVEPTVLLELGRAALDAKLAADTGFAARFYRALAVFLADRVRNTNAQLGYGKEGAARTLADEDELDEAVLDNLHLAGARFEAIIARLAGGTLSRAA